jgi:hypothetical protein
MLIYKIIIKVLSDSEYALKVQLSPLEDLDLSKANISKVIGILASKELTELNIAVLNILNNLVQEISRLVATIDELEYVSLHTRNLFELYLILTHIYTEPEGLSRWYGQLHKDSEQIREGFRKLLVKKGLDTSSLDEVKEFEDNTLKESPYTSERNFNISHLARVYGYEDDYAFIYKLSSKLVHPSSMKVNHYKILTENDKFLKVIISSAMFFGQKSEKLALKISRE